MPTSDSRGPYGLWSSPLTPAALAQSLRLSDLAWDSDGRTLVWLEGRSGRGVLVATALDSHESTDLTETLNVQARVGYGGGDFAVAQGQLFFAAGQDGRIYTQPLGAGAPRPLSPGFGFAAAIQPSPDGRHLLYLHSYEDQDSLALLDTQANHWPQRIAGGHDFYMQPCWHPGGRMLAWVAWDHPRMPWDGCVLELATLHESGELLRAEPPRVIAGDNNTSIFQPAFSPDGRYLAYVSDASGSWQLYLYDLDSATHRQLSAGPGECGRPAWGQGQRSYAWGHTADLIYCVINQHAHARLVAIDLRDGSQQPLPGLDEYSWFEQPTVAPVSGLIGAIASSSTIPPRVIVYDPVRGHVRVIRRSSAERIPREHLATAQPVSWLSDDGAEIYGLYYAPTGSGLAGELPPAILRIHGGPSSQSIASYRADVQFFTTRGYAVLDVNYRGSTGYGRAYTQALAGNWGLLDVEDAASAARFLVAQGLADPQRLLISGSSAGGYTVLETLARYPGLFRAAICSYGVSNLFALAADTHKFEAHYLDSLIGPLPQAAPRYRERSPIFHANLIVDPIAIYQGDEDRVVPRAQSDSIVESLRARRIPHLYQVYPGEGHGWRKSETIEAFYRSIEQFLRQYLIFS